MRQQCLVILSAVMIGVCSVSAGARAEELLKGRGIVTATGKSTVTLGAQGWELVLQVDAGKTPILNNQPIKLSEVHVGDDVYATYDIRDKKNWAKMLWVTPPQAAVSPSQLHSTQAPTTPKR